MGRCFFMPVAGSGSMRKTGILFSISRFKIPDVMKELFYILAVLLIFGWLLGFAVFEIGGIIHLALPLAVVALLLTAIKSKHQAE